jgi:hypothetical protein
MDHNVAALTAPALHVGDEFPAHLTERSPMAFRHTLTADPALSLESVALLAESLDDGSVTCEAAIKPLVVPEDSPTATSSSHAAELIRHLDEDESWLTLLNIEQSPSYRALIDHYIDAMARSCGLQPSTLRRRMGFIFASSPRSVTPVHFDIEHSLLIQLRGNRTLSFGTFADSASRAAEVHRYWTGSFGRLQSMPIPQMELHLGPGDGAYIPPYYPHWLQNEDAPSLSTTMTFFTRSNEDETFVQIFNERLRRMGRNPRPEGTSSVSDGAKAGLTRCYMAMRRLRRPERSTAR